MLRDNVILRYDDKSIGTIGTIGSRAWGLECQDYYPLKIYSESLLCYLIAIFKAQKDQPTNLISQCQDLCSAKRAMTPQFASCPPREADEPKSIFSANTGATPCNHNDSKDSHYPTRHAKHDSKISVHTTSTHNLTNRTTQSEPSHDRHYRQSHVSVSTQGSAKDHKEYLDRLEMPSKEEIERIAHVQEQKEVETIKKRLSESGNEGEGSEEDRKKAAELIQRNYRGHRARRTLDGKTLDASTRWVEAVKEARYRNLTTPRARASTDVGGSVRQSGAQQVDGAVERNGNATRDRSLSHAHAMENWKKIGMIARRAGWDEDPDGDSDDDGENLSEKEREERRKKRMAEKQERQKAAKIMDLQYFLEVVDLKHRYGSNLRTYHEEWKKRDTHENFFYWLDYGEGRFIDCQGCPRERLDRERVRYLSKEERLDYLVKIDSDGRLCWAKNGARIDTTSEYRDSIHGIVPVDDPSPPYAPLDNEAAKSSSSLSSSSSSSTSESTSTPTSPHPHHQHQHTHKHPTKEEEEASRASKYATPEVDGNHSYQKVSHISASTIFNKLLRGSVKKNTWIFVADTSFRLYVGIKQSGAFQHSSFLHGSRISAAGLIKIKDGRLTKLSPLSGHYRPPVSNFRAFVHSLKGEGVDMSRVSISRSYAVLVGLEAYVKGRRRGKKILGKLGRRKERLVKGKKAVREEEERLDMSESARRERKVLEEERERREEERLVRRVVGGSKGRVMGWLERGEDREREREREKELEREVEGKGKEKEKDTAVEGPEAAILSEGNRVDGA
ncbi:IQ calmodulin-binding domain-containing protein [Rutstroemia sp. NJR-2017a WRK4]|nr:IQ calmodulin-binding domain-containing protein [Rutstroemia sp. NJR-2017a WRK4]